jgi:hypothetical protein
MATLIPKYTQVNTANRTIAQKFAESISVKDYGAIGDGTTDDTAAIQAALNANSDVFVPEGTYLISSTISIPANKKLSFAGGRGIIPGTLPKAYLIKKSTMTTNGIELNSGAILENGGLICQVGNTGDGVAVIGNRFIIDSFYVQYAGNDGIRVGTAAGGNFNVGTISNCISVYNGRYGLYIHDGKAAAADANVITVSNLVADYNTSHGIILGNSFWVTLINALTQANGGWGLYIDPTVYYGSVASSRYHSIVGGDFNEGNTLGSASIGGYGCIVYMPEANQALSITGEFNSLYGTSSIISGGLLATDTAITAQIASASTSYPFIAENIGNAANGRGVGTQFKVPNGSNTSRIGGQIKVEQATTNKENMIFEVNVSGSLVSMLGIYGNANFVGPATDNVYNLGQAGNRWATVYAGTGTINTSDGNEKQDVKDLSVKELAVAKAIKGLIKSFKFKDAIKEKGSDARIHVGVIAQDVKAAFETEGLDASNYALFCSNTWTDDSNIEHTRLGIRYDELLAFVIASL